MNLKEELIELRKSTDMNRREFCEYFDIPYRTVQDWESGKRSMPSYLLRLMRYKVEMENMKKENMCNAQDKKKEGFDYRKEGDSGDCF